jgi:hypothetical protein
MLLLAMNLSSLCLWLQDGNEKKVIDIELLGHFF